MFELLIQVVHEVFVHVDLSVEVVHLVVSILWGQVPWKT